MPNGIEYTYPGIEDIVALLNREAPQVVFPHLLHKKMDHNKFAASGTPIPGTHDGAVGKATVRRLVMAAMEDLKVQVLKP